MSQWKEGVKLLHEVAFDSKPPETCIELFEAGRFEGSPVFIKLADRIQKANDKWIEEFLGLGGLEKIFETLAALSNKSLVSFAGAVPELECARCIKSIMNHRVGMDHALTTDKKFIHKLAKGLSSDSELMKTEVFQLLSAVCMYSSEGHKLVIDACGLKQTRSGYSLLVEELRAAKMDECRAAIVAFINCLLARCNDVEERLKIRHELAALNYQHLLSTLRDTSNDVLSTQIDVFNEGSALDQKKAEEGIDITDHKDVFRAVYAKVAGTPNALSFLHILQHLMLMDRDSKKCNMVWEMLEKIVMSAVMMSEGNQAAADNFVSASTEKIKKALTQVVNDPASIATSSSSTSVTSNTGTSNMGTPQASNSESGASPPVPLPTSPAPPISSAPPPPASSVPPAPPPPPPSSEVPIPPPPPGPPGSVPAPPPLGNLGTAVVDNTLDPTLKSSFEFHSAKKLHILNWKKLSRNVVQAHKHCLWLECTSNKSTNTEQININTEQIVELFCRKDISTTVEGRHESHHIVCLLDSKTGLNVSVFLKQFKGGGKDVIGWIQTFDVQNVTVEQMTALEKLLPDTNTIDLLTSHSGNQKLGDAEVFLLQLIKIDKYVLRVEVMKLSLEFSEKKQELQPALQLVCKAIDEIQKSKSLKRLLYIILVAGNFINSGGYSGKAYGFTITSLDNLGDTRANKPHMTFINYIASILQQQCPELLDVGKELSNLKEASRYVVSDITKQIQELHKRFEQFENKLNQATDDFKQQAENILTSVRSGLGELMADVKKTSDGKEAMMEFLCEDPTQCKLEEVLQCIIKFVDHLSSCAQENARLEEVEKKREIRKATTGNAPISSDNVVDKLLHEIRDGTTLRHRC